MSWRWKIVRVISVVGGLLFLGACSLMLVCGGLVAFVELPITLAFGWVEYLWRVVPQLNPDPWTIGTAVVCLGGVVVGSHYFLRWLAGGVWRWKRTLRGVALVVLMFVAGIAMVGMTHQTAWLVRSPEPFMQNDRAQFARTTSSNNLKQLVSGSLDRLDDQKALPHSSFDVTGRPMHSWQTALLPYLQKESLYKQIDLTKPWTHPANAEPLRATIPAFWNPSTYVEARTNNFGISHYAGNVFVVVGAPKTLDSFPQGASNTILAGEVNAGFPAWGDPLNARDPRQGIAGGPQAFGGPNRRPQFAMLDGSVRTFDPKELAKLAGKPPE